MSQVAVVALSASARPSRSNKDSVLMPARLGVTASASAKGTEIVRVVIVKDVRMLGKLLIIYVLRYGAGGWVCWTVIINERKSYTRMSGELRRWSTVIIRSS
jgi:hypothetical protein